MTVSSSAPTNASSADVLARVHALPAEAVLHVLESRLTGLTHDQAAQRLARVGPNVLRRAAPVSIWVLLRDQVQSVVVLLLIVAAVVALAMGDQMEAAAIGAVLVINTLLGLVTELRARRAMEALLRFDVPRATVIRDAMPIEIHARDLVPGDILQIEAGNVVPADCRLLQTHEVRTDEALLTGESASVAKTTDPSDAEAILAERQNMLYKGTVVVTGTGRAVVVATGMRTELGRIDALVGAIPKERTPLEHRLDALGRWLAGMALGVGAVVATIGGLRHMPWGFMIETGIALAIAAVPEGLPAVATIALAVGVRRMARRHALVRRLPSVETLGSVTVVCTDKTGTLTAGEMTVTTLVFPDRVLDVTGAGYAPYGRFVTGERDVSPRDDPQLLDALRIGMMANRAGIERESADGGESWRVYGDPTEAALLVAGSKAGLTRAGLLNEEPELDEIPFSSERMLMATFHRTDAGEIIGYVKGAPSRILARCTRVRTASGDVALSNDERDRLLRDNDALAARGMRVLALGRAVVRETSEAALHDLTFVAFAGLADPIALGVSETIRALHAAGIRTVMLTGDQRATAQAIARSLEIVCDEGAVVDGRELHALSGEARAARMAHVRVVSRVSPEDKLDIVTAFQRHGDIVAMLGDGVNDAAALKQADVGVAMGRRGTDVAKEAAAIVLQDDRFQTIGVAVEEGRIIFDNIRKFVFYLFSCNLAEVLVVLVAGVARLPLPLLPIQILWLNLVTDTFPALALAVEPGSASVMKQRPRNPAEAIISGRFMGAITAYGVLIGAATLGTFVIGLGGETSDPRRAITMSFMTLALAQTFHLGTARSHAPVLMFSRAVANPSAVGAVVLVTLLQLAAIYVPPLAEVLHVCPLSVADWAILLPFAAMPALVGQGAALVRRRRHQQ